MRVYCDIFRDSYLRDVKGVSVGKALVAAGDCIASINIDIAEVGACPKMMNAVVPKETCIDRDWV